MWKTQSVSENMRSIPHDIIIRRVFIINTLMIMVFNAIIQIDYIRGSIFPLWHLPSIFYLLLPFFIVRPAIKSISKNQTLNETNDVTLSCLATGKPRPYVTWSKDGNLGNILNSSSTLVLKNITKEQGGLYRCTADNGFGKAESAVRIIVQCK